jgi:hypothetical protein
MEIRYAFCNPGTKFLDIIYMSSKFQRVTPNEGSKAVNKVRVISILSQSGVTYLATALLLSL